MPGFKKHRAIPSISPWSHRYEEIVFTNSWTFEQSWHFFLSPHNFIIIGNSVVLNLLIFNNYFSVIHIVLQHKFLQLLSPIIYLNPMCSIYFCDNEVSCPSVLFIFTTLENSHFRKAHSLIWSITRMAPVKFYLLSHQHDIIFYSNNSSTIDQEWYKYLGKYYFSITKTLASFPPGNT